MRIATALLAFSIALRTYASSPLVEQGRTAFNRGDLDRAAELLEKAIAENPNDAEAHYLLADTYGTQTVGAGMFKAMSLAKKTKEHLDRAVELDPNLLDARMALLQYYVQAPAIMGGDPDKAVEQANQIRKRDPLMGHRAWVAIYSAQKKPDLARKEAVDAVKEQPSSPKSHYWLGVYILTGEKNYKAAAEEFETSIKLDPNFMPGWFQVGHAAALGGASLTRGEEALQKYLAYTPKHGEPSLARAHYWLGMVFEKQGKKAEARERYNASLRLNPSQKDVAEALKRVS